MPVEKITLQAKAANENFGDADTYTDIVATGCKILKVQRAEYEPGEVDGIMEVVRVRLIWSETIMENIERITNATFRTQLYELKSFSRLNNQWADMVFTRVV